MLQTTGQKTDQQLVAEILSTLDRWDSRLNGRQNQKREHPRSAFRSRILVTLPDLAAIDDVPYDESHLRVWARNISPAGAGFLYRGKINASKVVICLDPDADAQHNYNAKIVRTRKLQSDFFEYGAVFLGRVEA